MDFVISNNYIVFEVGTNLGMKHSVLYTGAYGSYVFNRAISEIGLGGRSFSTDGMSFITNPIITPSIYETIGMEVSTSIGPAVLKTLDVLIDFENNTIEFGAARLEDGCTIDLNFDMDYYPMVPNLEIVVNGRILKVGFDTGVQYPFVVSRLVDELSLGESIGQFDISYPGQGFIMPSFYKGKIQFGECVLDNVNIAASPRYDETIALLPIDGFLGINCLIENKVKLWISYANRQMVIVK